MYYFEFPLQVIASVQDFVTEISPYVMWSFIGISVIVVIVDIVLYTNNENGDPLSNIVRDWSYGRGFVLPFIWGILATHFFLVGPMTVSSEKFGGWLAIAAIVITMILIGIVRKPRITPFTQVMMLVFGVTASFLLTF
jgi:hypothetical protein